MSIPWEDRRGMFQKGREIHEPARKMSGSGGAGGVIDAVRRASTSSTTGSLVDKPLTNEPSSPTSQRRRSSASSGLFGNLSQQKRGGDDYDTLRASHSDQLATGGMMSGWFNSTFRGVKKPVDNTERQAEQQQKRGVME